MGVQRSYILHVTLVMRLAPLNLRFLLCRDDKEKQLQIQRFFFSLCPPEERGNSHVAHVLGVQRSYILLVALVMRSLVPRDDKNVVTETP